MAIYKSNKKVVAVYKGSTPIKKIYKGSTLVFQKSGGGGSTHLIEGTATGNFNLRINDQDRPITPDADGKWLYTTDETITSLSKSFFDQSAVTSVDLSNLDLTGISTNRLFAWCSNIESIKFNTTKSMKLVDVVNMFYNCNKLVSLDVSSFDTSNLTSVNSLFYGCGSLTSIDLSSFDTSNLTSAGSLFSGCYNLTSLDLSSFNTSNLTSVDSLFENCMALKTLDLSNFDLSKATNYYNIFLRCNSLNHIKCKQAFKDWCITNQGMISLPTAMIEGGSGTWEIVA